MSEKHTHNQIEAIGDGLARRAESGSTAAVNKELEQVRKENPGEYVATVRAMERSNSSHVQADRQEVNRYNQNKHFWQPEAQTHVPNLIIEDRTRDKSAPSFKLAGTILSDNAAPQSTERSAPQTTDRDATATTAGRAGTAGKGLDSDKIPFFAAFNESVAMKEADKVQFPGRFAPAK